jgi:hypothetical protein
VKEQGKIAKCDKMLQQQSKATKQKKAMLSNKQHRTTSD